MSDLSRRTLSLELSRPFSTETNTSLWFTVNEAAGRFSDYLGEGLGADEYLSARSGFVFSSIWGNWATTFYSHEGGHSQRRYYLGCTELPTLDWGDWSFFVPAWSHPDCTQFIDGGSRSPDFVYGLAGGLNQQQHNARFLYEYTTENDSLTFDQGMGYLMNQAADLAYFTVSSEIVGDVGWIEVLMNLGDNYLSREEWVITSLLSTALSFRTWESFYALGRYAMSGERSTELNSLQIGTSNIYPPDFSAYIYPYGLYLSSEWPVANLLGNGEMVYFEAGVGTAGDSREHIGISVDSWQPFDDRWYTPELNFDAAISFDNGDPWVWEDNLELGFRIGMEALFGSDDLQLGGGIAFSNNDVLHNIIDGQPNGLSGRMALQASY